MDTELSPEVSISNEAQPGPEYSTRQSRLQTILSTTQAIGRASAVFGVKTVSDVAAQTFEALKEVHSNKELCDLLATRIRQTLGILHTQVAEFEGDSVDYIPASIAKSVQQFTRDLDCILSYLKQLSKQRAVHKFIRRNSTRHALEKYVTLVEDARSNFLLSQLGEVIHTRRITQQIESSAVAVRRDGLRLVRRHELVLLGDFQDSDYQLVSVQGGHKLAKQYRCLEDTKYEVDLSVFKRLNHASLPQIFGVAEDGIGPMILFHFPISNRDLTSLLRDLFSRRELWKLQALLLRMCHDFQAALMHLREKHIKWTKSSAASHANMFVVNEKGHCVLTGGVFSNQDGRSDEQELQFHTVVAIKDSVNSATAAPRGHVDVLSRKLLDWVFFTERPFEPWHADRARYGFPAMTIDDVLVQPSCTLRSFSTSWLGTTSFSSSMPCQPGDILLVRNYAIPDIEDKKGSLPVKLCNMLAHFGGRTELIIDSQEMRGDPTSVEIIEDPVNIGQGHGLRRSFFQGVRIISRHMQRKQSILHTSEVYSRYCAVVAQIARLFDVRVDELALVTDCTAHIRYNAFFNRRKDRCLPAPDIYLFEPQDLSYMPHWSFRPNPDIDHTPLGPSSTAVRTWRKDGFSTECWIEKYHVGLIHLELGDLGSSLLSGPEVNLDDAMIDSAQEFHISRGNRLPAITAEQASRCD